MEAALAVADPIRRRVLELVRDEELPAGVIAAEFEVSRPAVSRHLRVLREAGLVDVRQEGRHRVYQLNPAPPQEVFDWVQYFEGFWRKGLRELGKELDRTE